MASEHATIDARDTSATIPSSFDHKLLHVRVLGWITGGYVSFFRISNLLRFSVSVVNEI